MFNALPGAYLLLTPEGVIEAASDEYLAATLTTREQVVGRSLFDVFPDNPAAPEAHATRNQRASMAQVLATGQPHQMAPQHYTCPTRLVPAPSWSATGCPPTAP
ncbi:PAS domain-containing protein [Hymenobacter humi]|uniref:PAS domain-containing protein n=1 Tax=Hymenobacter humi TaxID=1411620 RepID=A0ABW2UFV5_9BACT